MTRQSRVNRRGERVAVALWDDPLQAALALQARADLGELVPMEEATTVMLALSDVYERADQDGRRAIMDKLAGGNHAV